MNQHDFEAYLARNTNSASSMPTGQTYKDSFGQDAIIVLPQNYWDYVDWLKTVTKTDIEAWIVECDTHRGDKTLSENLMEWLWWDECDRHRQGHETPTASPPLGFQE